MTAPDPSPLFVGSRVISLKEVDSTNSYALKLLREQDIPEGTVVTAVEQSEGRGQRGAHWLSSPGMNFTGSIILKPSFLDAAKQFDLNRIISLAVADLLIMDLELENVTVKWPNDILVEGKKICGILIENILSGSRLTHSVAGIGLNINQENFPSGFSKVTSLKLTRGKTFNIETVARILYGRVEARYLQLRGSHSDDLRQDYLSLLYRKGIETKFTDFKSVFAGQVESVTAEGRLIIRKSSGEVQEFGFKEIGMLD